MRALRFLLHALLAIAAFHPRPLPAADSPPRTTMLASSHRDGIAVQQYWVSEKLDGVRGRWDGEHLWTRGGHRINAPAWFTRGWPAVPMDGELWMGRGHFERTSAIVRTARPGDADWRDMRFMVFDLPAHPGAFEARLVALRRGVQAAGIAWLRAVPQVRVADARALEHRLDEVEARGGEGLMLHHRDSTYRNGRSEWLLKYKRHDDAEARVVAHLPGKGKYEGMTGSLLVERADGVRFRLGSGLSDAQRAEPPPLGAWVTYRHDGFTSKGLPRFARFLRVRHGWTPQSPE